MAAGTAARRERRGEQVNWSAAAAAARRCQHCI